MKYASVTVSRSVRFAFRLLYSSLLTLDNGSEVGSMAESGKTLVSGLKILKRVVVRGPAVLAALFCACAMAQPAPVV